MVPPPRRVLTPMAETAFKHTEVPGMGATRMTESEGFSLGGPTLLVVTVMVLSPTRAVVMRVTLAAM